MPDFTALGLPADLPDLSAPNLTGLGGAKANSPSLTKRQKAAVVIRALLSEGENLALDSFPSKLQADVAKSLADLPKIDAATEKKIISEFLSTLETGVGRYNSGMTNALSLLEGAISGDVIKDLSQAEGGFIRVDPWPKIANFDSDKLATILEGESGEVAAICLTKLPSKKAAEILGNMEGPKARYAAFSVSRIKNAQPDIIQAIGTALLEQLRDEVKPALSESPAKVVGSILLPAKSRVRDEILEGLGETDADFAEKVRGNLFVYADIGERINTTDIPKILRSLDQADLLKAFKYTESLDGADAKATEFILENMSKRMAETLKEELADVGSVSEDDGDAAMALIVQAVMDLEQSGEISLIAREPA